MEVRAGYKQTEVGVIPEDWKVRRLGDICGRVTTGKLDANAMVASGEYPFFTCAREHYWIDEYAFDADALLVSGNGANVGYVHHYTGKFNAYQRTYVLTDFDAEILYLRLFMDRYLQNRLRTEVNAGNTPYITMGTLTDMSVALPSTRDEQRAIATALSDVDALLAAQDKLIAKKRDIKQAAMQQLLTGKQRLPGFGGEWEVKRLGDICGRITTGKLDANAMVASGEYPFFTCAREHYFINEYAFDADALLVSGNGANVGYVHHYTGKFNAYQRTYVLTDFTAEIVYLRLFMDKNLQERLRTEVNAGNTPYITMDTLTDMSVALPRTREEQAAIATALSDMDAELAALEKQRDKTRALKQGMMQELLTGRIRLI